LLRPQSARDSRGGPATRPLLVTADDAVLDDVLRLAVAAGVTVDVAHDGSGARRLWGAAALVVVGPDLAASLAMSPPPRRGGVLLIASGASADDPGSWQVAVTLGAEDVVILPAAEDVLVGRLADTRELRGAAAQVVGVIGGRGGAGASVMAAAIALAASRSSYDVMLVDTDPLGGGLDLLLGLENDQGTRWSDLARARGRVNGDDLRATLPGADRLAVLSWDRGDPVPLGLEAMQSVLDAGRRTHDLVVVDLPRHLDEVTGHVVAQCDLTLLVVPAEVRAVAAAQLVARQLQDYTATGQVVVRGDGPGRLAAATVCEALELPLAGELSYQPALLAALERGQTDRLTRGSLGRLCLQVLAHLEPPQAAA